MAISLAEGERIAQEITSSAEVRVNNIIENLNKILLPRQQELLSIEQEIKVLSQQINEKDNSLKESIMPSSTVPDNSYNNDQIAKSAENSEDNSLLMLQDIQPQEQMVSGVDQSETSMRMDAFVDVRYWKVAGQSEMQHHALQLVIDIEVPVNNYSASYTRISSSITSAIQRYNNVTLNEIFPFDLIEPNPQNIAMYFYNYLEDTISLMDLCLNMITIRELPDLIIQVNSRNSEFDNLLHRGEDLLSNIREALPTDDGEKPNPPNSNKKPNRIYVAGEGWIDVSKWR